MDINDFIEQKKNWFQMQIIYNFLKRNGNSVFNLNILSFKNHQRIKIKDIKEAIEAYFAKSKKIDKIKNINERKELLKRFKDQVEAYDIRIGGFSKSGLLVNIFNKDENNAKIYTDDEKIDIMGECYESEDEIISICPICSERMKELLTKY